MFNSTVIMSGVDYFNNEELINPFMKSDVVIDRSKADSEHHAIQAALESAGVTVKRITPPADCQDGVFTANWALVRGNKAVMARLPNARKNEEPYAKRVLEEMGIETILLPENLKFSGQGDALPYGNYLFCGSSYRSDEEAQRMVAEYLGYERVQLRAVPLLDENNQEVINSYSGLPDSFFYDLDLAISILKPPVANQKGLIAWCPEAFTPESQTILRQFNDVDKIEVSLDEAMNALCCNLVSTGQTVIMNAGAPNFTAAIEAYGLKTTLLSNPELAKGGGSMRCTTLSLNQ